VSDIGRLRERVTNALLEAGEQSVLLEFFEAAVAHELAEKIIGDEKAAMVVYRPGLMWAAEVIDPQPDDGD
jgi:hypothetical protein